MNAVSWELRNEEGGTRVVFRGQIDEHSKFGPLLAVTPANVTLDLEGIERINSSGVREWIEFVNELRLAGKHFALDRCSIAVVAQLNMVTNFAGKAPVRSMFVPYFCESCDDERLFCVKVHPGLKAELSESRPCPVCQSAMELDDSPDRLLAFLE